MKEAGSKVILLRYNGVHFPPFVLFLFLYKQYQKNKTFDDDNDAVGVILGVFLGVILGWYMYIITAGLAGTFQTNWRIFYSV